MSNKNFFYSILAIVFSMLLFTSCKKTNEAGKYIPKEAAFVVVVNGESLAKKLPWEELKNGDMFKELSADSSMNEFNRQALENPELTGVDVKDNITVFVVKDSTGGYAAVQGKVKDAGKFKNYFTTSLKGATASNANGLDYLVKDKMTLGWNKDRFIVIYDLPQFNSMNSLPSMENMDDSNYVAPVEPVRNGTALIKNLFELKEDNSLAKNEKFGDLMKESGDVHFYVSAENFRVGSLGMAALSMLNIGKLTEGAITTAVANFEDGKIIMDSKSYAGKELSDLFKKYNGSSFNTDMIKRSPINKVAFAMGFNFKPQGVQELLRLTGLEGFANLGAKQMGFSVEDFVKANKGDIAIIVGDFPDSLGMGTMDPKAVFATSINDKAAFAKLIAAGSKLGQSSEKFGYAVNDNYFSFASTKSLADAYIAGNAKNDYDFVSKISGEPIGGYVDLQYLISALTKDETDSLAMISTKLSLAMWENVIIKGGNYDDGAIKQHIEVNLMDKKTNSLKQLNNYANKMAVIEKQKQANWSTTTTDESIMVDTVAPVESMSPAVK